MNKIAASIAVAIFFLVLDIGSQGRLPAQRLTFSGYEWEIRRTSEPEGPADNQFGGRDLSVFLTEDKALQLSLAYSEGVWWAGEVYIRKRLGYGTYVFRLDSDPARLDPNLVLGLFTYASNSSYAHREIDIEFSAWGVKGAPTLGQFVVQPYQNQGHVKYFPLGAVQGPASYSFTWLKDSVDFAAWKGHGPRPSRGDRSIIAEWTFADKSAVPPSSTERVHINLYLAHGNEPPSGRGVTSVLIRSFEFTPANK